MAEYLDVYNLKSGNVYRIKEFKSYDIEQDIEIPGDYFEFVIGNENYEVSNLITAGDKIEFFIDGKKTLTGYIDDIDIAYSVTENDIRIVGRDLMAILLDNDAEPKTYNNMGLKDYMDKVLPKYGIKDYSSSSNKKFKKITISPGETEYAVIERLSKERSLQPLYNADGKFTCTKLNSNKEHNYLFSNDDKDGIRIKNMAVTISSDIVNEVKVYGGDYEKNKNITGIYKDNNLKISKRRIYNESDIESNNAANDRAKEEFYNINKNAFVVNIVTTTKQPININNIARIKVKKMGLNCLLLVTKVRYHKSIQSGTITNITCKLIQGVRVTYKNHNIPL